MKKVSFKDFCVLVDMDDTIEDLVIAWVQWLNKKYGLNVDPWSISEWHIPNFFPTLTAQQVYDVLSEDGFWETVQPKQDAIYYLKQLMDDGFNVYICTCSDYRHVKTKFEAILTPYFPYITSKQIIIAANKQMVRGDFLVDDGIHNLIGGDYEKILVTAPHNQNYNAEANGMFRANDWKTIYHRIVSIATSKIHGCA